MGLRYGDLMLVLHRPIEPTTKAERRKIAAAQNDRQVSVLIWQLHHGEGHDASREE